MRTIRSSIQVDKSDVLTSKKLVSKGPISVTQNETTTISDTINLISDTETDEEITDEIQILNFNVTKLTRSKKNPQNLVSFTYSNCSLGADEVIIIDDDSSSGEDETIIIDDDSDNNENNRTLLNVNNGQYLSELYNDGFNDNEEICSVVNEESDSSIECVWLDINDIEERIDRVGADQGDSSVTKRESKTTNNKFTNEQLIREADLVFKKVQEIEERKRKTIEKKKRRNDVRKKKEDERKKKEEYKNEIEMRKITVDEFFKSYLCQQKIDEDYLKNLDFNIDSNSSYTTSQHVEKINTLIEEEAPSAKRSIQLCLNEKNSMKHPIQLPIIKSNIAAGGTNTIEKHQKHFTISSCNPPLINGPNNILSSDASISSTTSLAEYFQAFRDSDDDQ